MGYADPDFDPQPSTYEVISRFGIPYKTKPCSCCGKKSLVRIEYEQGRSYLLCSWCDVEDALKALP